MWVQHLSSLDFLTYVAFFGVVVAVICRFVPGRPLLSRRAVSRGRARAPRRAAREVLRRRRRLPRSRFGAHDVVEEPAVGRRVAGAIGDTPAISSNPLEHARDDRRRRHVHRPENEEGAAGDEVLREKRVVSRELVVASRLVADRSGLPGRSGQIAATTTPKNATYVRKSSDERCWTHMGRALPQPGLEEVDDQRPRQVDRDEERRGSPTRGSRSGASGGRLHSRRDSPRAAGPACAAGAIRRASP